MATSSYESTPETTNTNRVCRVILGPCTDGLRDILRQYVPPTTFPHVIKHNKLNLPRLTADQRDLILPHIGSYTGNYDDMDISLLYILLRNITVISPHSNGWGYDPDPIDRSLSANIDRIRLIRNKCYGHSISASMSYADFHSIWSDIRSVMIDLDTVLLNGNYYQNAVDSLRNETMDPELDQHYETELRKQLEEDRATRKMVVGLKRKIEETAEETKTLQGKVAKLTESPIPTNVREQHNIDIQKWIDEDKRYYETHSFPSVMEKVRNQPYVTFVGVPGSGKSATAQHIALKLQKEGYEVVPVDEIREIKQYCDTKNPQVFVINDVVGVFGLQKTKLDVLTDYEKKITESCNNKSRTLMTCRETVFNEALDYKPFLTKEENVIMLHNSDHALDDNDKKEILKRYGLSVDLLSPALLKSTPHMFPLLCKLSSKETKFRALGTNFFLNPVQCIIKELDKMQIHNKLNYATLVLCMLNENSLSEEILEDENNETFKTMKNKTLKCCKSKSQTEFLDALSAMKGTYTKQSDQKYTLIHDSMFEICAYHYGKQFPEQMLLYMSSSYIANYVKAQKSEPGFTKREKQGVSVSIERDEGSDDSHGKEESDDKRREESFDLCIRLREDQYPLLAERLYRDIQNMELYDVFRNPVLKHPQVCQAFIGLLKTKSYTELKSLFLSSRGKVDKIVSKREGVKEREGRGEDKEKQLALVDERDYYLAETKYNVRAISWVIYYGHFQILEYIIQQTEQHNEISELFHMTENSPHQSRFPIYLGNEQESEINRLIEQYRLLLLSCYSGDVQTVRVLFPMCKKAINGIHRISVVFDWSKYCKPLTFACERGHVGIVKELLKTGAEINPTEINDCMIYACQRGHVGVVEELVKAGAVVNLQVGDSNTPLIAASKGGHASVAEKLVKAGADVNLRNRWGDTPLIAACQGGHVSVVDELMKARANINLQDDDRNTPLIAASKGGHASVAEKLVKAGADVNLQNRWGNTPLIAACQGGHVSVVDELMKSRADVNLQDDDRNTPLIAASKGGHASVAEKLVKAGADVNLQNRWGNTPLIAACQGGHVSVVEELMKVETDVNLQNYDGNTPLIAACEGGHMSRMMDLVNVEANVNPHDTFRNIPRNVVEKLVKIWEAKGHLSLVEKLVKIGADVNLQNRWGNTPLIVLCQRGQVNLVKELVKARAVVNLQDRRGNTPLIVACRGGYTSVVEELVKVGSDVNLQNDDGNTPLILACQKGHTSVVEELVKAGADVNLQGRQGNTPMKAAYQGRHISVLGELEEGDYFNSMIYACQGGQMSIVDVLVKAGAYVNLQGDYGFGGNDTPLTAAVKMGSLSTVKSLVEHGADWVTQTVDFNVSAVYRTLVLNKPDIMKYLIEQQNKINPGKSTGNIHLFNCLVDIRHAGVKTDCRDDVVVTDRSVWCMDYGGNLWRTISRRGCDVLRHLLCVGLDVNQLTQVYYQETGYKSDVKPLFYTLIDEWFVGDEKWYNVRHKTEKVSILFGAGVDISIRARHRECDSVLDKEGVSILEMMRRKLCKYSRYSVFEYKEVMCEIRKRVRRHSV